VVEVNPVVNQPSSEANRRWTDASEQGPADAQIACRLRAGEAARLNAGAGCGFIEIGHDAQSLAQSLRRCDREPCQLS
jgi:hypothetical protein